MVERHNAGDRFLFLGRRMRRSEPWVMLLMMCEVMCVVVVVVVLLLK
jgi:hypothetical protein